MKRLVMIASAAVATLMMSGGAYAAGEPVVTPAQIEAAKTAADHEAIAAAYDKEAARLEALAKEHEVMARTYTASAASLKGMNGPAMAAHCNKLSAEYAAAAKENRELAAAHRQMEHK
jgi:hypothetical protein